MAIQQRGIPVRPKLFLAPYVGKSYPCQRCLPNKGVIGITSDRGSTSMRIQCAICRMETVVYLEPQEHPSHSNISS